MRIRTLACLSLAAGACAVAATGFPRRIGLTASQADVSLPGDLILPGANVVVDRGIAIDAPASVVWDVLGHVFEPEDESTIIDIEDEDHILMRVAPPAAPEGAEASGTCVISLLPLSPSRTLLHIRERHEAQGRDRALAWRASPPSRCRRCRCCAICAMRASAGLSMPD